MADGSTDIHAEPSSATKSDLKALEAAIVEKLTSLLQPLQTQMSSIASALTETKKVAEKAMELTLATQEGSREIQYEQDRMKLRLPSMETEARMLNVKIRGIPEKAETDADLVIFISHWIASILKLERDVALCITRAYRLGSPISTKRTGLRDIIFSFLYMRDKVALMREARRQDSLRYGEERVELYQDLPAEALALRKELKPITSQLAMANKYCCWVGPAKLQTIHNGITLTATDIDSGMLLLQAMGLANFGDPNKKTPKRKLDLLETPPKDTKVIARAPS